MQALAKSLKQVRQEYKQLLQTHYIALEEMNFFWKESQVKEFDQLWREGWSIYYISDHFNRDPDEVLLLYLDRIKKGYIYKRRNGILGWRRKP